MKDIRIVSAIKNSPSELRTSTVLDKDIIRQMKDSMLAGGYGQRERSRWINEAIDCLSAEWRKCEESEKLENIRFAVPLSSNGSHITIVLKQAALDFISECQSFMHERGESIHDDAISRLSHYAITMRLLREQLI